MAEGKLASSCGVLTRYRLETDPQAGGETDGDLFNGDRDSAWEVEKVLEMDGGSSCTTM